MKFAIPVVLVAVLGLAGWIALSPAKVDVPRANAPTAAAAAPANAPTAATPNDETAGKARKPGAAKPRSYAKPAARAAAKAAARRRAMAARPRVEMPPVDMPTRAEPVARKWGRMGKGGTMPSYSASSVKDGIRRYYGNLPENGRIPARIEIEEVLPRDLVRAMNLPSTAQIVEMGHYPTTDRKAFTEALAIDPSVASSLGITALVDGERYREYINLTE
jgi:hypothetical protein